MFKTIHNRLKKWIEEWPTVSYLVINKILWIVGFFYSIYVIQGFAPTFRQFVLGSIYALITLPLGYWITALFFQVKKEDK
jgi:hypothetical protein